MRTHILILFLIGCIGFTKAQTAVIKIKKEEFIPAKFPGGADSMKKYLDRTVTDKIKRPQQSDFKAMVDINASGKITKVELLSGSGFSTTDSVFTEAIRKMPLWIPAVNDKGKTCSDKQIVPLKRRAEIRIMPSR